MQDTIAETNPPSAVLQKPVDKSESPSEEQQNLSKEDATSKLQHSKTLYENLSQEFLKSFDGIKKSSQIDLTQEEQEFIELQKDLDEAGQIAAIALGVTNETKQKVAQQSPSQEASGIVLEKSEDKSHQPSLEEAQVKEQVLEEEISSLEKKLGIETSMQRALEASLLIDSKFFYTAVIAGYEKPERLFGDESWADWIAARAAAREYGLNQLTVDFIKKLHEELARRTNPKVGGEIRNNYIIGGDYKNLGAPALYSEEQFQALQENLLGFQRIGTDPRNGLIIYPHASPYAPIQFDIAQLNLSPKAAQVFDQSGKTTAGLVEALLVDLCSWYNIEKERVDHDSYSLAADLQRKLVSIHPFNDINGRLSRLLMNWSLENDNLAPSILEEPSDDIVVSQKQWKGAVQAGSIAHEISEKQKRELEKIGYENIAEVMELSEPQTFYKYIFKNLRAAPVPPQKGEVMKHAEYEEFLGQFKEEQLIFEKEFTAFRPRDRYGRKLAINQGGLIPQSLIDLVTITPKDLQAYNEFIRKNFFMDLVVYRGGISQSDISEGDVVRMFEEPVGLGTGYHALADTNTSPLSPKSLDKKAVVKTLEYYNNLISAAYIGLLYGSKSHNLETIYGLTQDDLPYVLSIHLGGSKNKSNSPFVSTSADLEASLNWANPTSTEINNPKHGILFEASAPLYGGILAFGGKPYMQNDSDIPALQALGTNLPFPGEEEVMIPGALIPPTIQKITIYDKDKTSPGIVAQRETTSKGDEVLKVFNLREQKQSFYILDKNSGIFVLLQDSIRPLSEKAPASSLPAISS